MRENRSMFLFVGLWSSYHFVHVRSPVTCITWTTVIFRCAREGERISVIYNSANSWQTESLDVHSDNSIIRPSENIYLKYVVDQIPRFSLSRILKAIVAELGQHLGEYYRQHRDCGHKVRRHTIPGAIQRRGIAWEVWTQNENG